MKQADIKQLSTSDLRERIKEGKSALTKLKLNHAVSPIENPAKITDSRKTVARLLRKFNITLKILRIIR